MKPLLYFFLILYLTCHKAYSQAPQMVKDIFPYFQTGGSVVINNILYFQASDGLTGRELWRSDGTSQGTYMVKDLYPGASNRHSNPKDFFNFNGTLFFNAQVDGRNRLVKSDGTSEGTQVVIDRDRLNYYWMDVYKNKLYFLTSSYELWTTDGTEAGTILIKSFGISNNLRVATGKDYLYFTVDPYLGGSDALWRSDGTAEGTKIVKTFAAVGDLAVMENGTALFSANDGTYGNELWKSDGTETGTVLVKNIRSRDAGSSPNNLFADKNTVYFNATEDTNVFSSGQLWQTDGTESGTKRVATDESAAFPTMCSFERSGNQLIMLERRSYANKTLYVSDNTNTGLRAAGWFMAIEEKYGNGVTGTSFPRTPEGDLCYFDLQNSPTRHGVLKYSQSEGNFQRLATLPSTQYPTQGFAMVGRTFLFGMNGDFGLYKYDVCQHSAKINTANGTSFCPGGSVNIVAEGVGGTGPFTYKWKTGSSDAGTAANLAVTAAGTYTVEVTDSGGCTVSASVEITQTTNLPVSITGANSFCQGQASVLKGNVSGGVEPYTYQWKLGSTNIGGNTDTFNANSQGSYSLGVTDKNGCTGTSSSLAVTQKPAPNVSVTTNRVPELLTGETVVLSVPTAAGQTYQWANNGSPIAGATNNSYTTSAEGNYTVTVTGNGCTATSAPAVVSIILSSKKSNESKGLRVAPNPATMPINVILALSTASQATISVTDTQGKSVSTWRSFESAIEHKTVFDLRSLPSGIYFINSDANGEKYTYKLIKH